MFSIPDRFIQRSIKFHELCLRICFLGKKDLSNDQFVIQQVVHWSRKSQGNMFFLQCQGKNRNSVKWSGEIENLQKSGNFKSCSVKNREYDQEIPQTQIADKPVHHEEEPNSNRVTPGRQTKLNNQLDKQRKATSSLSPIKMIAVLEWTQSYPQQKP